MSGLSTALVMAIRLSPILAAAALAACGSAAAPTVAGACDRFAARDGSDRNPGTEAQPFKTVQRLADELEPGQTGCLGAGTYDEEVKSGYVLRISDGGRPGRPITIQSRPGERARLEGVLFFPEDAPHVTLREVDIDGRAAWLDDDKVTVAITAADVTFEDNRITNRGLKSCMILGSNDGWGRADRAVIRRNVFHGCGDPAHRLLDHGIYVENARDGEISENVFYGTSAFAVHLYPNAQGMRVTRNVMVDNGGGVIVAGDEHFSSSGNVIERNVIAGSRAAQGISISWSDGAGSGNVARDNCLGEGARGPLERGPGLAVSGNVVAEPEFVDADARDYRLRPGTACAEILGGDVVAGARSVEPAVRKVLKRCTKAKRSRLGRRARARCARAARRASRRS